MKFNYPNLIIIFLILLSHLSCLKDEYQDKLDEELRQLQNYIKAKNYSIEPDSSGLYYVESIPGNGPKPVWGDYVLINYTGILLEGQRVFITTDYDLAYENGIESEAYLYGPTIFQYGLINPPGINIGLKYMEEGTSAKLIFPSPLGFGYTSTSSIPAFSSLIYDIELLKVIPNPVTYENDLIQLYLEEKEIIAIPNEEGLYYVETLGGTGEFPSLFDVVQVRYSAYLLDGRLISTTGTNVLHFQMSSYLQGVVNPHYTVKGLRDALRKMKPGGKATVIVPHNLAFGSSSANASSLGYKFPIPPYSTVVYDVELVAIME